MKNQLNREAAIREVSLSLSLLVTYQACNRVTQGRWQNRYGDLALSTAKQSGLTKSIHFEWND